MTGTWWVVRVRFGCPICCFNVITKRWEMRCKSCDKVDEEPGLPSRARARARARRAGFAATRSSGVLDSILDTVVCSGT